MTKFDNEIDAIGLKCPMPILKCKKGLNALKTNQILKIKTTDKSAKKDFEAFCRNTGHDLILFEIEDEITTFYIKKN
jgi:tRNA 2-thiouridine synthesizing protein A